MAARRNATGRHPAFRSGGRTRPKQRQRKDALSFPFLLPSPRRLSAPRRTKLIKRRFRDHLPRARPHTQLGPSGVQSDAAASPLGDTGRGRRRRRGRTDHPRQRGPSRGGQNQGDASERLTSQQAGRARLPGNAKSLLRVRLLYPQSLVDKRRHRPACFLQMGSRLAPRRPPRRRGPRSP